MYQRALHNLLLLRIAAVPNEPNPISGHLQAPRGQTTLSQGAVSAPRGQGCLSPGSLW
jgi:hypothetical protein